MTANGLALAMIIVWTVIAAIVISLFCSKNLLNKHQDKMADAYKEKKGEESCSGGDGC